MTTTDDALATERRRANAYELLAACYHEPDDELLRRVSDAAAAAGDANSLEGALSSAADVDLETLRLDHTRLFVGPFEVPAPPYESVYVDNEERVMTESTVAVEEAYRREGLDVGLDEPADHVAAELEFVYVLVVAEIEALENGEFEAAAEYLQRQYDFLVEHLGRWVSELADDVREHADTEFYRSLADETQEFVESDGKRLAARLDRLEATDDPLTTVLEEVSIDDR